MMKTIVPSLKLAKKSDIEFDEYVADKLESLDPLNNPNFPILDPDLATVTAKHSAYNHAVLAADGGNTQQRQTRDQLRDELHVIVTNLAYDVAKKSNNNLAIYMTSGFDYRRPSVPAGDPVSAENFRFAFNKNEAELVTRHQKAANAVIYELWIGTTPVPPAAGGGGPTPPTPPVPGATWWKEAETSATTYVVTGLTSGTRYYGMVITKGRKNKSSAPSNIATKICP